MNPYLQEILHDITTRLAKLESIEPTIDGWPLWSGLPPPKKEWLSITDKEMLSLYNQYIAEVGLLGVFRIIEAKLKEKNA